MGLPIVTLASPIPLLFANKSKSQTQHAVDLGPLGLIYLVHEAADTLLSLTTLVNNGFSILMSKDGVKILDKDGCTVYDRLRQPSEARWSLDLFAAAKACAECAQCIPCSAGPLPAPRRRVSKIARPSGRILASTVALVFDLHQRCQHLSPTAMAAAFHPYNPFPVESRYFQLSRQIILTVFQHRSCVACMIGKINRVPRQLGSGVANMLGAVWAVDCIGPVHPPTMHGCRFAFLFSEQRCGMVKPFLVRENTAEMLSLAVRDIVGYCKFHDKRIVALRFDAGSVMASEAFQSFLQDEHIESQPAAPDHQEQDFVERDIQTVRKRMAANFADQMLLPLSFWGHNMKAVCIAINSFPNHKCPHSSPLLEFTGITPDVTAFTTRFGEPGVVSLVGQTTINQFDSSLRPITRQDAKNEFAIALGFPNRANGAVFCYIPGRDRHQSLEPSHRKDFTSILEQIPELTESDRQRLELSSDNDRFEFNSRIPELPITSAYPATVLSSNEPILDRLVQQPYRDIVGRTDLQSHAEVEGPQSLSDARSSSPLPRHREHRSGRVSAVQQFWSTNQQLDLNGDDFLTIMSLAVDGEKFQFVNDDQPRIDEALVQHLSDKLDSVFAVKRRKPRTDDNPTLTRAFNYLWHIWKPPCDKEFDSIIEREVREIVQLSDIPYGVQILQTIMDLKTKRLPTGVLDKLKARLLVLGDQELLSLVSTFAPNVDKQTLFFMLMLLILLGIDIHEMDIVGAFLYSKLEEPVYVRLPSQFRDAQGNWIYWKLLKALYGMRRAPLHFFVTLCTALIAGHYVQSPFDTCLFTKFSDDGHFIVIFFHVDNIYYGATSKELLVEFETFMELTFKITKTDSTANILGMLREINVEDSSSTLSMPMIVEKLVLRNFGHERFATHISPMTPLFTDEYADQAPRLTAVETTELRGSIGLLGQLVPLRADIAKPHNVVSCRLLRATQNDVVAMKRIVRYLAFTNIVPPPVGLTLFPAVPCVDPRTASVPITMWSDYAHNCHPDSKGHGGVGVSMGNERSGLFHSQSQKLSFVTDSTTAGEIAVGVKVVKRFEWMRNVIESLHLKMPKAKFHIDNASMFAVCTKLTGATKRLRHMLLHINYILERKNAGLFDLVQTPSNKMVVDVLTKIVPPALLWSHMPKLLGDSEALRTKCAQAQRILAKEEEQPYAQIPAPSIDDEDDRADQLLKRTRLEEEEATTTASSSSPSRSASCVLSVISSSVPATPVRVLSAAHPSVAAISFPSSHVGSESSLESLLAAGVGAAATAAVSAALSVISNEQHHQTPTSPASSVASVVSLAGVLSNSVDRSRRQRRHSSSHHQGKLECFELKFKSRCGRGNSCPFRHDV